MFNLEKLQTEFKSKQITEFQYYSTLVKELTRSKETVSLAHLPESRAAQLDVIAFERFVNITGETNNFDCTLLIDTETGYLYSPRWFNTNNRTFATIHDYETFVSQQVIAGFDGWELVDAESFEDFEPVDRIKWFDSKIKNQIVNKSSFYCFHYQGWSDSDGEHFRFYLRKTYHKINEEFNSYISHENSRSGNRTGFQYLGRNTLIEKNLCNKHLECELLSEYFPNFNINQFKNEKLYQLGEAYPFIYSRRFADLDIWGNKFSAFSFIQFLVDNDFDTSFLPKAPNLMPYILEALQKNTGIQLHQNTITFPSAFFKPLSEVSKHQDLIAYLDFLLWKIEYYGERHQTELSQSNILYSQLSQIKTDNAVLNNIQQYLLQKFDFSLQNLEEKLLKFKAESITYLESIDCIDSLSQFNAQQIAMDFNLIGEAITRLFNNQILKVSQFAEQVQFLSALFEKINALFNAHQEFITAHKTQLHLSCEQEYVEDQCEALLNEWQAEISAIEQQYFPIIEASFIGTLSQSATLETLALFEQYRDAVDKFFLSERIALIHQYNDNPKSLFLQKIDMESKLFKHRVGLRNGLKALIANESQHLTKKLLNAESQNLLSREIGQLLTVSQNAQLSEAIQTQFNELGQRQLEIYLSDVEQYGLALEKRDKDIQSLLFKMKKDLERQPK
jgi:hypothetical protein